MGLLCKHVAREVCTNRTALQTCNQSPCNPYVTCCISSSPTLLFEVLCLPGDQSHPFVQPTINPLACCICWAGLWGRAVFPPWNEGQNSGSYSSVFKGHLLWASIKRCNNMDFSISQNYYMKEQMKHF